MTSVKSKRSVGTPVAAATIVTTIAILIMTLGGELYGPLKAWLAATFGHHWIGKGVLSIVIFLGMVALFYPYLGRAEGPMAAWSNRLLAVVIVATVVIVGFYAWHFFG